MSSSNSNSGTVKTWPRILLRLEGTTILGASLWGYHRTGLPWWVFAGCLLLPDIGMTGYLANTRAGAATYNSLHTSTPPILLLCAGWARDSKLLAGAALCWLAHIGMDRMAGYGLKYGTAFGHTHLGFIGGAAEKPVPLPEARETD
ncbi:uncharacterized protein A1O9_02998 [Exophiala aquamarina CBS 119918]|uniref:DUF4260 domain-containing protein n=1 Tax=Exophiala aquamarina CBS 119918 TaxID=1182545 RepID=A0A072PNX0_9EURO|nr:uncharacterized protein A1O9_02998 [Exophiala aquamarina CBS 119918]KEF61432.1 hypothetical protein A1O9_02998 [Exophiala aquamarina CBS 119918]